jgi:DNA-binding response OmpR family regulator
MSARAHAGRTVLIVDDYPAVLAWAAGAFRRAGWEVRVATDAEAARLEWLAARAAGAAVTLLLTDLGLPGLDGLSLARQLREDEPMLPVLIMHGGEAPRVAAQDALPDPTAIVEKPLQARALLVAAESLMARARPLQAV